ncbi:heavy metal-associated isoprenylated plant protein 3 [Quercus suber]|uniref:Heavy metal-associated isoprenylated plant protein 3 n=1 Tax=Quercus suber TaxID=58331 RepID=A0AAW0J9S2_QUESU|nr:heavy metal-associated isoprenylated plant protein 3 [Quercus suber]POF11127.1 heavy metal-associated isoprenylated plant protein 3 [Quercus suber]
MAKKKNKNKSNQNPNQNQKANEAEAKSEEVVTEKVVAAAEEKKDNGGGEKKNKDSNSLTAVYKIDMHCEGCATKIKRCVKDFQGVEDVKAEMALNKLTVFGKVDPTKLRDYLSQKTKKNVELVSPLPPKKDNKAAADDSKPEKKAEEKKPKEAPVTTAVLKLSLHCQGCIGKINRLVLKTKGVQEMKLDKEKELVTVKGTMDAKALAESLKDRLKRSVEVVPPKKEKEGGGGDGDKKDGGGGKKKGGGDGGKEQGGGGGSGNVMMENRMEFMGHPGFGYQDNGYGYGSGFVNGYGHANGSEYGYGHGYGGHMGVPVGGPMGVPVPVGAHLQHAPNMFSDENPNACSIM